MRGLLSIPNMQDREKAYAFLEHRSAKITPEQWALWSQWTRFDPRLAELWAKAISLVWRSLDPFRFREALLTQPWPACAGVLFSQVHIHLLDPAVRPLFRAWSQLVLSGVPKAENQFYFIGTCAFAGKRIQKDAESSFKSFLRWGFLGQATFVNKASNQPSKSEIKPSQRRAKLDFLISQQSRLTVQDYIAALPEGVSIRQAQLDLASHPRLKAVGNTRGRFYVRKRYKLAS
jgi:hypothetical protein